MISFPSLIIVSATDVAVRGSGFDGFGGRPRTVESGFENGADGGVIDRVDGQSPLTGCLQTIALVASRQRDDPHGGAISLLRMRALTHHPLDQGGGVAPDPRRHRDKARGLLLCVP